MRQLTFEDLKTIVAKKELIWQHVELGDRYNLFAVDGTILYESTIYKANTKVKGIDPATEATRITDYQDNFKAGANKEIGGHSGPFEKQISERSRLWITQSNGDSAPTSGTGTRLYLLRMDIGETKIAKIQEIVLGQESGLTTDAVRWVLHRNPTITSDGTDMPGRNLNLSVSATAKLIVNSVPTLTANGPPIAAGVTAGPGSVYRFPFGFGLIIKPDKALLIRGLALTNAVNVSVCIRWTEEKP